MQLIAKPFPTQNAFIYKVLHLVIFHIVLNFCPDSCTITLITTNYVNIVITYYTSAFSLFKILFLQVNRSLNQFSYFIQSSSLSNLHIVLKFRPDPSIIKLITTN